ncbi:MAG: hypothetical protein KIT62_15350 [Cyclobacteriaceae bacterium]|nr:hypothetical protein [Cyclobacteriaceae bacterium]
MKLKFSYLFSLAVLSLVAVATHAQEGSQGPEEMPPSMESSAKEDKPLIYEPEGKASNNNQQPSVAPVITSKPKSKSPDTARNSTGKPEDEALSFNFLLHIIQKFKSSDVLGQ